MVRKAFGDDALLFLPAPDFGNGSVIGGGVLAIWCLSNIRKSLKARLAFIEFAMKDQLVLSILRRNGAYPANLRRAAAEYGKFYADGGALWKSSMALSEKQALVRPVTPGYIVQAKVFEKALADIANGADVARHAGCRR